MPVVGDTLVWTETLTDDAGNPVSGEAANFSAVTARKPDGTTAFSPSIAEIGATGSYRATVTSDAAGSWYLFWHHVDAVTGEITGFSDSIIVDVDTGMTAARAAKLDTLGAASVTVQSAVVAGGDVQIVAGNSYLAADGNALTFTLPNIASSLNGRTATLTVLDGFGGAILTKMATIAISNGTGLAAFDLTSTDTNLTPLPYRHKITATFPDGGPVTLAAASFDVGG